MKYSDINKAISLSEALTKIKTNKTSRYEWYIVKNNKNSFIEVGGHMVNNKLVFKSYIPKYKVNKIVCYQNGFTDSSYAVTSSGSVEYPTYTSNHNKTQKELINFLDDTDFKTYKPTISAEIIECQCDTIIKYIKL